MVSNPTKNICIKDGKIGILKLDNYKGEYDQGVADLIDENTIEGFFVQDTRIYFVINNNIMDITNKNIECTNNIVDGRRDFILKIDENIIYEKKYDMIYSFEDLVVGYDEEDDDYLLYLSDILSSEENINKFIKGHSISR